MSATIPQWMLGKNVQISATLQAVAASGALTAMGSAFTFVGRLNEDGQTARTNYTTDPISPLDCVYENDVDVMVATTYTLSEIMQVPASGASSGTTNSLDYIARNSRIVSLQISWYDNTSPTPLLLRKEIATVKWNEYNPSYRKGKSVGLMTFKTLAIGNGSGAFTSNPILSDS